MAVMRRLLTTFALALVAATAAAAPGYAQEDGVTLDPSDPAAKEYALPVEQARREASGAGDAPVAQGSRTAETFGVGVTPDADKGKDKGEGNAEGDAKATTPAASSGDGDAASKPAPATQEASAEMGSTAVLIGGGLATLLIAGFGGFALRAVRGPTDE